MQAYLRSKGYLYSVKLSKKQLKKKMLPWCMLLSKKLLKQKDATMEFVIQL